MDKKYVYGFYSKNETDGSKELKNLLGGKGANLAEMMSIGIPVPPGFTISTEVCAYYNENNSYPEGLAETVKEAMGKLEKAAGKKFGSKEHPLLVSVRSGAAISMPGMMDTILNLGLNDESVEGLANETQNPRFAYDAYRRFLQMFGDVALGISHSKFEAVLQSVKDKKGVSQDTELDVDDLKEVVEGYKKLYKEEGKEFPQDPEKQLWIAIDAVFGSWNNERAIKYREINKIEGLLGTAVNVVSMVFGNMGDDSATGVAFTRNPNTGEKKFYGEFLPNAQGEDVVAGIRTPYPLEKLGELIPPAYNQLLEVFKTLENHYKDMQDVEFTIEKGRLYILQTRTGKRTSLAAVKIAVNLTEEGLIDKKMAVLRVNPSDVETLLHPIFDLEKKKDVPVIATGLPASPGAASGMVVFDPKEAEKLVKEGKKVILVRSETSPEDIGGMASAEGILTARGGMTSHAAVVARGMGKPAVVGCESLEVDEENKVVKVKESEHTFKDKEWISIDGTTGEVMLGEVPTIKPKGLSGELATLLTWADEISHEKGFEVRTNADQPEDAKTAREFGALGIGLTRTEHMFFDKERINVVRRMIVARSVENRKVALNDLLPMQRSDFYGILKAMNGLPVTIRLLDPPLHEFLPNDEEQIDEISKTLNMKPEELREIVESLHEFNPMLGHRGCRLFITYPEIAEMQARAIIEAAIQLKQEGFDPKPEIMIPLVTTEEEIKYIKEFVVKTAEDVMKEKGQKIEYKVGTMIETPRAALTADEIAKEAEFFSFGTNDLTQTTFAFSRDDVNKFLPEYLEKKILKQDPFKILDRNGVGKLVQTGVKLGRSTRENLKIGICGEHGGEPSSIEFAYLSGLNYVSCSPYRVPVARLAAAQAVLKN